MVVAQNELILKLTDDFELLINSEDSSIELSILDEIKGLIHWQKQDLSAASSVCRNALNRLGVEIPAQLQEGDIEEKIEDLRKLVGSQEIENLNHLPTMTEEKLITAMRILQFYGCVAYALDPKLYQYVTYLRVCLSIEYGNSAYSAGAYSSLSLLIIGTDIEKGTAFGKLAKNLVERFHNTKVFLRVRLLFAAGTRHWQEHYNAEIETCLRDFNAAIQHGELETAADNLAVYASHKFWAGKNLNNLGNELIELNDQLSKHIQESAQCENRIVQQTIVNLNSSSFKKRWKIDGKFFNKDLSNTENITTIFFLNIHKIFLAYLFKEYSTAINLVSESKKFMEAMAGAIHIPIFNFYETLNLLALYPDTPEKDRPVLLETVHENQQKMKKWALYAPMNYLHKWHLAEAERAWRVSSDIQLARMHYKAAIEGANDYGFIQEEALGYELYSNALTIIQRNDAAAATFARANELYERWGATAKINQLRESPQGLNPLFIEIDSIPTVENKKTRILYVEDDTELAEITKLVLSEYELCDFSNGRAAIEWIINGNQFDIGLFDVEMPEMNGVELAKEIRRRNITNPIIFLTGSDKFNDEISEISPFLFNKPIRLKHLKKQIELAFWNV